MSAVAGIFHRDGLPVRREDLERMGNALAHRGPDRLGLWYDGPTGMVQRDHWTTPEAQREHLPLRGAEGTVVVVADARVDNRSELCATLNLTDRPASKVGDGELMLRAYLRWGEQCPEHLLGDFAFAIWDGPRQRLFCARDPMGVRSLSYFCSRQTFAFATELKALLALPGVPRRLNETRVAEFLVPSVDDPVGTFYRDLFRLPAAHAMVVTRGELRRWRYWSPDPSRELRFKSDEEYVAGFREAFTEAVRCRLRSVSPVGSTLSGGLDSSSIACVAGELLTERGDGPLRTFSAIFPSLPAKERRPIDERPYVEAVLARGGFDATFVHADELSPLQDVPRLFQHTDEPYAAPNSYLHLALYRMAQQRGSQVFLDGIDGDTTVSHGLGFLAELAATGRWRRLRREATALAGRASRAYTPWEIIWSYGFRPLIPASAVRSWRWLRRRPEPAWSAQSLVHPELARRVGLAKRLRGPARREAAPWYREREAHRRGLTSSLNPSTLELAGRLAGAFAVEPRYPFFDRRLMEYCLALPPEQKLRDGWTRSIMRRAMTGLLPPVVQWRPDKANLSGNFTRRLLACERETLDRVVLSDATVLDGYVDRSVLRSAYARYLSPQTRGADDAATVYRAVMLALWLET